MAEDERDRWVTKFRDQGAAELLDRYRRRNELSPVAITALRDELKLRGLDPDSLRATVPRAEPAAEETDVPRGEMQPPPEFELPETARTSEVSANVMVCPRCQAPNHPDAARCRSCGARLGTDIAPARAGNSDRIGPAVIGLLGITASVFGAWVWLDGRRPVELAALAAVVGIACIAASVVLHRRA